MTAIDLGEQWLQGAFVKPGLPAPTMRKLPTQLMRCDPTEDERACGLLQMAHSVPPEILYSSYWYRSGTNQTMRSHLEGIVQEVTAILGSSRARVLDIGCNDGTLLRAYPESFDRCGIDPSDIAADLGGDLKVINDFFPSTRLADVAAREGGFDAITSIAMFYDLEDPVRFAAEVRALLNPGGIWIFEMSYMPLMLERTSYDTICHEHLEYYSLAVLEQIVHRAGLKLIRCSMNEINGGSIRCVATHQSSERTWDAAWAKQLSAMRHAEFDLELETDKPYRAFQRAIEDHRDELRDLVTSIRGRGERIHVYGASTKGNTILQWVGLDHTLIEAAADRNPAKHGARTLGTDIPIISEEQSRASRPDYYLVLPWHFRDEFLERERDTLAAGVRIIFPLPRVEIVAADVGVAAAR